MHFNHFIHGYHMAIVEVTEHRTIFHENMFIQQLVSVKFHLPSLDLI